jgi:hypothetical protein
MYGNLKNRQMAGVRAEAINMASIPQASQEIDNSPGPVGIGKMVRLGGRVYPARSNPSRGKPSIKVRRIPRELNGSMEILLIGASTFFSPVLL